MSQFGTIIRLFENSRTSQTDNQFVAHFRHSFANKTGYIFGMISAPKDPSLPVVSDKIENSLELFATQFTDGSSLQHQFEQTIQSLNDELAKLAEQEGVAIDPSSINAFIGAVLDDKMVVSGLGKLYALYLHPIDENKYRVYDLFKSLQTDPSKANWNKLFTVVLDGDLEGGDRFLVSNINLFDYLAEEDINQIITTLPAKSALSQIEKKLSDRASVSLLLFEIDAAVPASKNEIHSSESSIHYLENLGRSTSAIMGSQNGGIKGALGKLRQRLPGHGPTTRTPQGKSLLETLKDPKKLLEACKPIVSLVASAAMVLIGIISEFFISIFRFTKRLFGRGSDRKEVIKDLKRSWKDGSGHLSGRFKKLPKVSKYIFVSLIIIILIIVVSTTIANNSKKKAASAQEFTNSVQSIEDKIDSAEAAVIYGNETGARTMLRDAQSLLDNLTDNKGKNQDALERLGLEITAGLNNIRHIINVDEPKVIGSLPNANGLIISGGSMFLINQAGEIYKTGDGQSEKVELTAGDFAPVSASYEYKDKIYFIDDRPGITVFDPAEKTITAHDTALSSTDIKDIVVYNDRLYVLAGEQIYKHSKAGDSFGGGSAWLNSETDLSNARSLIIDGNIYVLSSNDVDQYLRGNRADWSAASIDPPMNDAIQIWTGDDNDYVYILDRTERRLAVLDKDGDLVNQYISDMFTDLRAMVIKEGSKRAYLLSGDVLYQITLTHLN